MTLRARIAELGGVARASELAVAGFGAGALASAVRAGDLVRPRKGWYVDATAPVEVVHAIRVGGSVTCATACRLLDLWVPDGAMSEHVSVPPHASRLRSPTNPRARLAEDVVVHWGGRPARGVESIATIVDHVSSCFGDRAAFAVLESAVQRQRVTVAQARRVATDIPALRSRAPLVSARSESGGESLAKLLIADLGLDHRQQVDLPGVGRVDFLVGSSLVIEIDSRAHHADALRDRRRDAAVSARGGRTLRFLYAQVAYEPDAVTRALVGAVVRGDTMN